MNRRVRESGVAAIELVFSLPFLIVFLVVFLFYGYAFMLVRASESAASAGAQAAVTQSPVPTSGASGYFPGAAAKAAALLSVDNQFKSVDASSDAQACIAPLEPRVTTDFVFSVRVNFDNCDFLERLRIKLPLVGKLPPNLGTYTARAEVQL